MTEKISNLLQGMEQVQMNRAGKHTLEEFMDENKSYAKETTLGALTAIYSLYGNFSFQFLQLGRYFPELIGCFMNAQNIFEFLEEAEEPKNWYLKPMDRKKENWNSDKAKEEAIRMQEIDFCYQAERPVIHKFSMSVAKGECVAITGASGCGKTTLSKLLISLYPVNNGEIFLNGQSYRKFEQKEIRKMIAYVPQEPYLFCVSVRENIRIGRVEATEEEIEYAAKLAYAHTFILELEQGYDTYVGERGNRLSGGQRQRIAIARAIRPSTIALADREIMVQM